MNENMELARQDESAGGMAVKSTEIQAEVQAAAVLAMNRPRDEGKARERITMSCQRPAFADGAEYRYERGSSVVQGPSVKLARELARCWGNIRYGIRVLSMTAEEVQIEGWAWDLETNSRVSSEARFGRKVQRKQGGQTVWVEADERNLRELVNKHGAIAVRNSILQLLPPDVVDGALRDCRTTLKMSIDEKLEQDREGTLRKVTGAWRVMGVEVPVLEHFLGRDLDDWTGEDVAKLRSVYQSVRDGNSDLDEHFDLSGARKHDAQAELDAAASGQGEEEAEEEAEYAPFDGLEEEPDQVVGDDVPEDQGSLLEDEDHE